jgi:hypothetical protein
MTERLGRCAVLLALSFALRAAAAAGQTLPPADSLLRRLDDLYRASSSHAVMTMTVRKERGGRDLTLEAWSRGKDEALIVIRAPAREAGTATLRTAEGLWNYAPRADRLIRIPTGLLGDDWMGSHFTNDDLVRETSWRTDYSASLSWEEPGRLIRVSLTPRPRAPVVYSEVRFFVHAGDWVPTRSEYYDDGALVRTMTFDQVRTVAGRPVPMRLTLVPADAPGESTVLQYTTLELDVPVAADLFSQRGLRRTAGG